MSLVLALLWLVAANVTGMVPSKHRHWPQAYVLIAVGLPILAAVFWQHGLLAGFLVLAAAGSILRWPARFALRWCARRIGGRVSDGG